MRNNELILYRNFKREEILEDAAYILSGDTQEQDGARNRMNSLTGALVELAVSHGYAGNLWQAWLTRAMLLDEAPGSVALTMVSTRKRDPIPPEITEAGLFDLCPYQDSVARFEVSRSELIAIINDRLQRGKKHHEIPVLKGIRAYRDASGTVISITPERDRYTLLISDFEAAGSGAAQSQTAAILREKPFLIRGGLRDKIRDLLSRSPVVTVKASPWLFRQK